MIVQPDELSIFPRNLFVTSLVRFRLIKFSNFSLEQFNCEVKNKESSDVHDGVSLEAEN